MQPNAAIRKIKDIITGEPENESIPKMVFKSDYDKLHADVQQKRFLVIPAQIMIDRKKGNSN